MLAGFYKIIKNTKVLKKIMIELILVESQQNLFTNQAPTFTLKLTKKCA